MWTGSSSEPFQTCTCSYPYETNINTIFLPNYCFYTPKDCFLVDHKRWDGRDIIEQIRSVKYKVERQKVLIERGSVLLSFVVRKTEKQSC